MGLNVRQKKTAGVGVYKLQKYEHVNEASPKTQFEDGLEKLHTVEISGSGDIKWLKESKIRHL